MDLSGCTHNFFTSYVYLSVQLYIHHIQDEILATVTVVMQSSAVCWLLTAKTVPKGSN